MRGPARLGQPAARGSRPLVRAGRPTPKSLASSPAHRVSGSPPPPPGRRLLLLVLVVPSPPTSHHHTSASTTTTTPSFAPSSFLARSAAHRNPPPSTTVPSPRHDGDGSRDLTEERERERHECKRGAADPARQPLHGRRQAAAPPPHLDPPLRQQRAYRRRRRVLRPRFHAPQGLDLGTLSLISPTDVRPGFLPVFRSGSCAEIGPKSYMEDEHVCVDNLIEHLGGRAAGIPAPGAFYGVFDGHGGTDAACFVRKNILKFIVEDVHFPSNIEKAIRGAFLKADHALADSHSLDNDSGTTALTALVFGRTLFVANAGDCRAVLGKRGRAVELSRDHKPNCKSEKIRIEKLGGTVFDGYLNGQLAVARALGDWHMKGPKGSVSPLSAEPELQEIVLSEEDEFLIIGCDGLWDVMTSQCAVTIVRKELMQHNDPERCSSELVQEALKRDSCDNLTVVVICFSSNPPPQIEIPRSRVRRSISLEGLHLLRGALDSNA